jgi:hypothetical protein
MTTRRADHDMPTARDGGSELAEALELIALEREHPRGAEHATEDDAVELILSPEAAVERLLGIAATHDILARLRSVVIVVGWVGGGPAVLCATRGQADMRGLGPQDRGFVVRCRCLEDGRNRSRCRAGRS